MIASLQRRRCTAGRDTSTACSIIYANRSLQDGTHIAGQLTSYKARENNRLRRKGARELFAGAISFCKNPFSHHEIVFEDPREVIDMISFANKLLRIVNRL